MGLSQARGIQRDVVAGSLLTDLAERLERAIARTELAHAEVARLLETSPRSISRWLRVETEPRPDMRERLLEVVSVVEQLSDVLEPARTRAWLYAPTPYSTTSGQPTFCGGVSTARSSARSTRSPKASSYSHSTRCEGPYFDRGPEIEISRAARSCYSGRLK